MPDTLILGEALRTLDDRYRISLPPELAQPLTSADQQCILAKERPGCLSLWNPSTWHAQHQTSLDVLRSKLVAGRLDRQPAQLQQLARLLSTRHTAAPIAGRGRVLVPEGFRQFLQVDRGETVAVVGAGLCVELWNPTSFMTHVGEQMPQFQQLFEQLTR